MKNQATVKIQCENQLLLKALRQLLEKQSDILLMNELPEELGNGTAVDFIVREENDLLRHWMSSQDLNGKVHLYIHPSENLITVTTTTQFFLEDVRELADLIVQYHGHFFKYESREENHNQFSCEQSGDIA